jgi:hypothetical protein
VKAKRPHQGLFAQLRTAQGEQRHAMDKVSGSWVPTIEAGNGLITLVTGKNPNGEIPPAEQTERKNIRAWREGPWSGPLSRSKVLSL